MSNKKRMRTVTGKVATRRVRPILPIKLTTDPDGVRRIGVYVVAVLEPASLRLVYVGGQLMQDTRGRHVLPHSQFVHEDEHHIVVYHVHAAIGELQTVAESVIRQLNDQLDHVPTWVPSPNTALDDMQSRNRAQRPAIEKPIYVTVNMREKEKLYANGINAGSS